MKKFIVAVLMIASAVTLADSMAAPEQLIRSTSKEVLDAIRKGNLSTNDKRFRNIVEAKALPYFDFTRLTAHAVGRYWRRATPDQQAELTHEFRAMLIRTYSAALSANKIENINVLPVKMASTDTDVTVRTQVSTSRGQPLPINYHMFKESSGWRVDDVSVEGASLVTTYRDNFGRTIERSGIDGLIKALVDRNATQPVKLAN